MTDTFLSNMSSTYSFSNSDEITTDTEDEAMATEAIHGCKAIPIGNKHPEMKFIILHKINFKVLH